MVDERNPAMESGDVVGCDGEARCRAGMLVVRRITARGRAGGTGNRWR